MYFMMNFEGTTQNDLKESRFYQKRGISINTGFLGAHCVVDTISYMGVM